MKSVRERLETASYWIKEICRHPNSAGDSLCLVRDIFTGLALIYENDLEHPKLAHQYKQVASGLKDAKVAMNILKVPFKVEVAFKTFLKTHKQVKILIVEWKGEGKINKRVLLRVGTNLSQTVSKTISACSKGVFDPLARLDYHLDFGPKVAMTLHAWSYVTLVGKGCKILYLSGEIIDGKKVAIHVCELSVETFAAVIKIIHLSGVRVHPAISLTSSIMIDIFDLFEIFYTVYQQTRAFEEEDAD